MGSGVSKRRVAYIRDQVHTDVKGAETALENTQDRWHEEDAVWLENEHAATVLASLVKCHWEMRELARLKFERDRKAATKIQTAQRCRVERLAYKRIQRAVLAVQRRRRGCGSAVDVCRKLQHMWHLAKIGRCPRLACRWYLQLRRSAAVINRLARGYFGRKVGWVKQRHWSARVLQCVLRMEHERVRMAFMRAVGRANANTVVLLNTPLTSAAVSTGLERVCQQINSFGMSQVVRPQKKMSRKATQLQRHYRRWMALRRLEICRQLLPKTKAAIWIQARVRAWLRRSAMWTQAAAQGRTMRRTLEKALPDEQAGKVWRRWARMGLTYNGLLGLRQNQLGGRVVFDASGRLIPEEGLVAVGGGKLKRASRVVLASQQSMGFASKNLAQPSEVTSRFRKAGNRLMLAQKLAKVPLPTREEEATAWDLQEQKWAAQEEEDNANKAELELELNERQSFITRMTEAGQTSVQFGLDDLRGEALSLTGQIKKLDSRAAKRAAARAVAAAEAAVREEERQLEEAAHAEAFEIVEWIVGRLLGVVVEECERKAREAASCGRLKLQSAMRKLRGADILGLAVVRSRREINWGLDPPDRWRLQKQLKIDGPAHRRRERIQGRWAGALSTQQSAEAATQIQCITRGRQLRRALRRHALEGGGWPQVKELLGHVGLSRIAGRLAKNGVDYVRLLSLKQANLGGPGQTLDVRWPTAMGGFKWIKLYLPRWGCHLDDVKRLRFRIRSIEAPRMARAKQLLEFRANVGKKKYAALAAEVKMVFEQLALSPSGPDEAPELDKAGFRRLMVKLGIGLNRQQLNETWRWMDKDGDGSVELDEFIHWWQKNREGLAGQSTALTRMFKDMFSKGSSIHSKHEFVAFGVDGVYQCKKCNLFGPSAPEVGTGLTYCTICLRCFVCSGGLPGRGEEICPGPDGGKRRARKMAKIKIRHGDAVHLSHRAYTEYLNTAGRAHNTGIEGVAGGDTRLRKDGSLASHSVSMTEYLGGGWETAAMGISALKEEADEVQEEYGVGAKARGELAEYNYVVGVGVVKSEPPQPPYQKWWATAGTPAADVGGGPAITDRVVKKRWMGAMGVMRKAAESILKEAELAIELQARTGAGAGAEEHATMLACARLILQQCEDVSATFGRPSDTAQIIAGQAQALIALGNPAAAAGLVRRGGGLQSPRSMFGDDTDSMRSGLSLETLPADGDGELPSIADRFKADAGKAAALALGDEGVVAGFVPRWPGDKGFAGPRCIACHREPARCGTEDGRRRWCTGCATARPAAFDLGLEEDMATAIGLPLIETHEGTVYLHGRPMTVHMGEIAMHTGPRARRQAVAQTAAAGKPAGGEHSGGQALLGA